MRMIALFALCMASIAFAGTIAFAAVGMAYWAIGCGCSVAWFLLIAARESDAARTDAEWRDARKHPRL